MKSKDFLKMEFIGLYIEVIESENKSLNGLKGVIVDETKNTFLIEDKGERKTLLKSQIKIKFEFNNEKYVIDGKMVCFRPEERIKKIK